MLPVMEDVVLAQRWAEGRLGLEQLLVYSAVCGTGLDTVPLPGDTSVEDLAKLICDVASLAVRLRKPLSARLLPVPGKRAGRDDRLLVAVPRQHADQAALNGGFGPGSRLRAGPHGPSATSAGGVREEIRLACPVTAVRIPLVLLVVFNG